MSLPALFARGLSTYVDSAQPTTDHSGSAIVPMEGTQTFLLRLGFGDVLDDAIAGAFNLTLYAAEDFDGSPAFSIAAVSEAWSPSVGYADAPTTYGSPIAFSGSLTAGQSITVNLQAFAQAVSDGTHDDFGFAITRTDGGVAGAFYGALANGDRAPIMLGEWTFLPEAPTNLVPCSGGIVGADKPIFSWSAPADPITNVEFQIGTTEVGFSEDTGLASPSFTSPTVPTTLPQYNSSTGAMTALTLGDYVYAVRHETAAGWSKWAWAKFGGYKAKPTVAATSPLAGIVKDPNPLYSWTVTGGTQAAYQVVTYPQGQPSTIRDDSALVVSATTSYQTVSQSKFGTLLRGTDSGVVLPDSSMMTYEFRVYDDTVGRQATVGCPVYALATDDFQFQSDDTVPAPDSVVVHQVGDSPFVAFNVTLSFKLADDDYLIPMLNGQHIARRSGKSLDYTESEGTYNYHYRYFGAQPFAVDGYKWSAKVKVGNKTSSKADDYFMEKLEVVGMWAGDADPQSDTYTTIAYHSGVGSTFQRLDQVYIQASLGAQFPQVQYNSKGWLAGDLQGTILDGIGGETATHWEENWHRLCGRGNVVQLAYDNISYPAVLINFSTEELAGSGSPWFKQVKMQSIQMGNAQLVEEPAEDEVYTEYSFEALVSGDATTDGGDVLRETAVDGTGSPDVIDIDGIPTYSTDAAIHGAIGVDLGWRS